MDEKPSKSARKREVQALQALGEQLIGLRKAELAAIPLDESLRAAVSDARGMKAHGALRRQKQLIGKLMRQVDAEPIRTALAALDADSASDKRRLHEAEQWRERLIAGGAPALAEFGAVSGADTGALGAACRQLAKRPDGPAGKRLRREIFRLVHAALAPGMQSSGQ